MKFNAFFFCICCVLVQTCLRHPDCTSSRENRDTVFCHMRRAIDLVHYVVKDGILNNDNNEVVRPSISSNNVSCGGNQRTKEVCFLLLNNNIITTNKHNPCILFIIFGIQIHSNFFSY